MLDPARLCRLDDEPPSHATAVPSGFCHAMSGVVSPLTSAMPPNTQPEPAVPKVVVALTARPFIVHSDTTPVLVFSHTTSALWSPLKSPVPSTFHVDPIDGAPVVKPPPAALSPLRYWT